MPTAPRGGSTVDAALADRDAVGFVHVALGDDPDARYLAGASLDAEFAVVRVAGETHLRAPAAVEPPARPGVTVRVDDAPAGKAAAGVLADHDDDGTVLVPRHLPHDAAVYLEAAGYDLASTTALADARAEKDDDELTAVEAAQRASRRGVGRAASMLAESRVDDGVLVWEDAPLSTERLRRQVNATLAVEGVDPAGATRVAAGGDGAGGPDASAVEVTAGDPVVVSVGPRGPAGYHGALARTFVVGADGGWERRANVACESARRVARVEANPGADAGFVGSEIRAETAAFGFALDGEVTRDVGGGVGLARREAPSLESGTELATGNVLRVRAAVSDPVHGRVELTDVLVVDAAEPRFVGDAPTGVDPANW